MSASASCYGLVGFAFTFLTWLFMQAPLIVGYGGAVIGERLERPAWMEPTSVPAPLNGLTACVIAAATQVHRGDNRRTTARGHP